MGESMRMEFPVVCWDCEKTLVGDDVRELVAQEIVTSGTVGQPAVKVRRITRLVCRFCYEYTKGSVSGGSREP